MPQTTIEGLSVYCEGDEAHQAIIFLHGFPFDASMWDAQIEELSDSYYCVSYDIRGLGASAVDDGQFTMESFVDDVETIVNRLKLKKPIICGFSMGGYIALRCVERLSDTFSALVLCDSVANADGNEAKLKRASILKRITQEGLEGFVEDFMNVCFSQAYKLSQGHLLQERITLSRTFSPIGVKGCLIAMLSRTDTTDFLPHIRIPTLLCCGEEDTITPPKVMQAMCDAIPNATFQLIENSAHVAPMENAKALNQALSEFLKGL